MLFFPFLSNIRIEELYVFPNRVDRPATVGPADLSLPRSLIGALAELLLAR